MSNLTETTRLEAAAKLREAADMLENGDETAAGKALIAGLPPVVRDLKAKYGPLVRMFVGSWVRRLLDEA